MAAQFEPEEDNRANERAPIEEDAAALRDLVRHVNLARPLQAGEQDRLLEQAALGDRASEDRLVAAFLASVIQLAGTRGGRGLSAADLGSILGVSGQSVYKWEEGTTRPRASQLSAIASLRKMGKRGIASLSMIAKRGGSKSKVFSPILSYMVCWAMPTI